MIALLGLVLGVVAGLLFEPTVPAAAAAVRAAAPTAPRTPRRVSPSVRSPWRADAR